MSSKITYVSLDRDVVKGDIVQIDPAHNPTFGGCLMIVTEPKKWGAQGYIEIVKSEAEGGRGQAYYRCPKENYVIVGAAAWIVGSAADEEDDDKCIATHNDDAACVVISEDEDEQSDTTGDESK